MTLTRNVTAWLKYNPKNGCYCHNHIAIGHAEGLSPLGSLEQTATWKQHKWIWRKGYLDNKSVFHPKR
jgi:hypothetical protein